MSDLLGLVAGQLSLDVSAKSRAVSLVFEYRRPAAHLYVRTT